MTGEGQLFANTAHCDITIKALFQTTCRVTRFLTAKICKKMAGWFLFMFVIFIEAAEMQMAAQRDGKREICITSPL